MWQKIKKGLQVIGLIGFTYFIYRILFVHCPAKDYEKLLASLIGSLACCNLFIDCGKVDDE